MHLQVFVTTIIIFNSHVILILLNSIIFLIFNLLYVKTNNSIKKLK